ncbi:WhiB family transcriptional regulator [Streptomyces sp. UG1]|uniref:WhiB family transcriptional regulator n=1 Tax=Streptomyces sp. UG1 TaxID=3417652 RepID=UPI003CE69E4F
MLCRAAPDAYFEDGLRPGAARALCAGCGHVEACLAFALEHPVLGVWGGTTWREREAARRRAAVERAPPVRAA